MSASLSLPRLRREPSSPDSRLEQRHRLGLAPQRQLPPSSDDRSDNSGARADTSTVSPVVRAVLLDPGGDVDRVADNRELEPARAAGVARDHRAGAEADADRELIRVAGKSGLRW